MPSRGICHPKGKSVVESVIDILNPTERLEKQIAELDRKIDLLFDGTGVLCSKIKQERAETDTLSGRLEE